MKQGRKALTIRQFSTVRDYLITKIEIVTCHRSGVSKNMTVEEFERAEFKEGKYIIKVLKHKIFRKYGPAQVKLQIVFYACIIAQVWFLKLSFKL